MKKFFKVLLPVLLVALLLGGGIWYLRNYQGDFFSNFLQRRGDAAMAGEHYTTALRYYRWAWELDDTDPDLAVSLASAYAHTDNYTKAEYTLVNAIAAMPEELQLYLALSETYVAQDKLLDASQLLDRVENESIRTQLTEARPDAPVLTPESGYYSEYISVGLEASSGTAYLSVDGSFPSLEDDAYAAPVQLTAGETSAIALCIGDNGLVSSAVYASYTIGGVVEPVTLQDSALDTYIRQLLELGQDDAIMSNALWAISELTVPQDVTSLADLRYFTGLKTLTIQNFQGGDFSFLENLSQLEHVDFTGSLVTSDTLSLLGQQKNLKWLNLSTCGVSDLSSLSGCTQLEYLTLANDHVADLTPLAACGNLQELYLRGNAITALDTLGTMDQLQRLDLSYNAVTNLGALAACKQLTALNLSHCSLADISAVGNIPSLTKLVASSNALETIDGLENCVNLTELDLSDNKLISVVELSGIDTLKTVNLNYNDIVNAPHFSQNSQLEKFYADHNFMEDLSGLANCLHLNYVTLDYNNISNIDVLANCYNLVEVNVFGTRIHTNAAVQKLLDKGIIVNYTPE